MPYSKRRLSLTIRSTKVAHSDLALQEAERRFADWHRRSNHSEQTIRHYQESLSTFRRFLEAKKKAEVVGSFTTTLIAAFQTWLRETPLDRTYRGQTHRTITGIHGIMKDLRAFAYWLVEGELLDKPPKIDLPKLPQEDFKILSDAQLVALFSSKQLNGRGEYSIRNRAIIAFLLDTGVRLSEIAGLTLDDLYLDDGLARVRGKGNKVRHVPFSDGTAEYVRSWLKVRHEEETTVFGLTHHGIKMLMGRIKASTGINIHCHMLRHTACTSMVRSNMDLHSVRKVMGHSHLSVTERYLSLSTQDLKEKHNAASPMARLQQQLDEPTPTNKRRRYT